MKVFLTGGNGNIGSAIKEKFILNGDELVAPSSAALDLSDLTAIGAYFKKNGADFDVVVHCAGYNPIASAEELSAAEFLKTENINVTALLEICKHVMPYFQKKKRGYVLGIASLYATTGRSDRAAYAASKHALRGLVQTLAIELGQYQVMCNTVSPGYVDTKMFRARNSAEKIQSIVSKIPLQRLAQPQDIADIVAFLCSPQNTYITGQDIIVDGGFMAGGFQ